MTTICFVLLSDDATPNLKRWREQDTHRWTHNATVQDITTLESGIIDIVFERRNEDGSTVSGSVLISPMPAPAQPSDERNLPGQTLWPEQHFDQLLNHKTHWIVASTATEFDSHEQALLVTQVADAILRSHSSAIGIVWGADTLRIYGPVFQEIARLHSEEHLPVMLWVGIAVEPSSEVGGVSTGMTTGMEAFDLMEIECEASPESPDALRDRLLFLCEYLIEYGLVISDGDTFGFNESDKLTVTYGQSKRTPDRQVMHLSYPEAASKQDAVGCMKSAAMVVAMMALGLGLIAGLVFGVGKVRSMFVDVPVQSNSVQSNSAQSNPAQSNPAQSNPAQSGSGESVAMNTRQVESDNSNTTNQPSAIEPKPKSRPPVMPFQSSPNRPRPTFNRPNPTLPPLRDRPPTAQTPPNPITQDFPSSMGERDFRIPGSKNPDPNNVGNDASGTSSEVASPRLIAQSGPLDSPAIAMVYSNDGKLLAVSTRGHLRIFDAETLRELAFGKTDAPFGRLVSIVFDRQGRFVIAGNGRGQFRWWRLVTGDDQSLSMERLPSVLQSQRSAIAAMTINDAGNLLVTVDQSGQLMWQRISEDAEKVQSATAETDLKGIQALHFDQASMSARICGVGGSVVCDLKAKTSEAPTLWQANSSAISVDGRWMVAAIGSQLRLFATDAIDPVHQLQVPRGMMSRVVFTSDDYVVGANTSNMTIWSVASGQIIANGEIPSVPRPVMASSPNGQRIAISSTVTPEGLHILRP